MVKIKKQLVSDTPYKYGRNNKKKYITIHETANTNKGADAQTHADLQSNGNSRAAAWHWQVDDKEAIQSFTHDFQLWQSGDGRGDGNLNSISVEICVNKEGDYGQAVQNAVELVHMIMSDEDIPASRVVQHHHWSGKDCPRYLRSGEKGPAWDGFVQALGETGGKVEYEPKTKPAQDTTLIRKGDSGKAVKQLQKDLLKAGEQLPRYGADGEFGDETEQALMAFQSRHGLAVDGIFGPKSLRKLKQVLANQPSGSAIVPYPGHLVRRGNRGKDVKRVQRAVGVTADGIFGPRTEKAVRAYQKRHGLAVDGLVGKNTWNTMF